MTVLRCIYAACLVAVVCAAGSTAYADTTYNLNATLTDGGIVKGTLTFGTVTIPCNTGCTTITGLVVTGDSFTVTDKGSTFTFLNNFVIDPTQNQPYVETFYSTLGDVGPYFILDLPGEVPLQTSPIGAICSISNACPVVAYNSNVSTGSDYSSFDNTNIVDNVASGGITALTPEPSSLLLLGTGLVSVVGAMRRRFGRG